MYASSFAASGFDPVHFPPSVFVRGVLIGNISPSWNTAGTADFNLDGKPDIIFENTSGAHVIWIMNGTPLVRTYTLLSTPLGWRMRIFKSLKWRSPPRVVTRNLRLVSLYQHGSVQPDGQKSTALLRRR
jgi:hypothetical protein